MNMQHRLNNVLTMEGWSCSSLSPRPRSWRCFGGVLAGVRVRSWSRCSRLGLIQAPRDHWPSQPGLDLCRCTWGRLHGRVARRDGCVRRQRRVAVTARARGGKSSRARRLEAFKQAKAAVGVPAVGVPVVGAAADDNWLLLVRDLRRQHRANLRDDAEAAWARARAVRHGCRGGGLLVASIGGGHELVP